MGSTVTKNQIIFQKSKSQVILPSQMNEIQGESNSLRSSLFLHKQKSLIDVRQKIVEQQSMKGDDCGDAIFEENLFDKKEFTQKSSSEKVQIDLNSDLIFEAQALQSTLKLSNSNPITIPAIISLKAKDPQVQDVDRSGLDLVCVIDRSGSMTGEKIQMVKETLKTLIHFLTSKDRLSVILFSGIAEILFKLKKATEEKKKEMREKIERIYAAGGTKISSALTCAFNLLKNRKQSNSVTSVFLLSDGQDNESNEKMEQIFQNVGFPFTLHTFGYGQDHDAKLMTKISNLGQGSFYFIQNLSLLDEFFADALGGLISVVGQSIDINIKCLPDAPFDQITIKKTYGSMWVQKEIGRNYQIQQNIIALGQRKDFVFELEIPLFQAEIQNNKNPILVLAATLKIQCPKTKNIIQKECFLKLNLINDDSLNLQIVKNIDVIQQYYRVKGTEIIEKARRHCENQNFHEAKKLIKQMILEIESDELIKSQSAQILQDLNQTLQASEQGLYQQYGQAQMIQIVSNNLTQSGMSAQFNLNGLQQRSIGYYSSSISRDLVNHIRSTKSTQNSEQY